MLIKTSAALSLELDVFARNKWTGSVGTAGRFQLEQVDDFIGMRTVIG